MLVGLLVLALVAAPGAGAAPFAYVSNLNSNTVSVVDGTTVLATVPVGDQPAGVAVNPTGSRVYVANSNMFDSGVPSVSVIDTASLTEVARITLGITGQPTGIAVSGDGALVYVTNNNRAVHVIDTVTNTVVNTLSAGEQPGAIVVAGGAVYAVDTFFGTVVNVTNPNVPAIFVSTMVMGLAANADGSRLYVANGNDTTFDLEVTVVDTTTNPMSIVTGTPVLISTHDNDSGLRPAGIAVSSTGVVYASVMAENYVQVLNAATNAKVGKITGISQPFGVSVDPSGQSVYVASVPANGSMNGTVTLIDGTTNTVVQPLVTVGRNPMAFGSFVANNRPIPPPPQVTLSLNKVGSGTVSASPASATGKYDVGTVVTITATPAANFALTGWSGDCAGTVGDKCMLTMNAPKSATATFTALFALSVTPLGNGTVGAVPAANAGKYLAGTSVTLTATPGADSVFSNWAGDCSAAGTNPRCTVVMNATRSVTANFALKQVTLTVTKTGTGTGTVGAQPSSATGAYNINTPVTLTASANSDSQFTGWSGDCSAAGSNPSCAVTMNAAKNVTATFTLTPPPPPPAPAPTTCDDTIKDLQKKVAAYKHPWWRNQQLKQALRAYTDATVELAKAKAKVGERDKRYVHAKKEYDSGKSALCHGHNWRAHHEFWETIVISKEILRSRR